MVLKIHRSRAKLDTTEPRLVGATRHGCAAGAGSSKCDGFLGVLFAFRAKSMTRVLAHLLRGKGRASSTAQEPPAAQQAALSRRGPAPSLPSPASSRARSLYADIGRAW